MKTVGLDFGTTNSTLAYLGAAGDEANCYNLGGAGRSPYIPSWVRFDRESANGDADVEIGRTARLSQNDDGYSVYSHFKMLLGETDKEKLSKYDYDGSRSPADCARAFIGKLIEQYRKEQGLKEEIDRLVVTVPHIWIQEHQHHRRRMLEKVCEGLGLPVARYLSEPVAAAAYFAHCHQGRNGGPFDGHILVCDYGGGTLDLSLSRAEDGAITVLESAGKGEAAETIGKAGVAFDEGVVSAATRAEDGPPLRRSDPRFLKLMSEFEEQKIDRRPDVERLLGQYLQRSSMDRRIFQIEGFDFKPSHLVDVFNRDIRPELTAALAEIKAFFPAHGVDFADKDRFRVVMAGGFSSFYLVRRTVWDFFGAEDEEDPRFDVGFSVEDTALAIAKGAALVAGDRIGVDPVCPISIELEVLLDEGDGTLRKGQVKLLERGKKISEYREPAFLPRPVKLSLDAGIQKRPLVVFLGDDHRRVRMEMKQKIGEVLPNAGKKNNAWHIGFSANENFRFTFHARDVDGEHKETSLGDIIAEGIGIIYPAGEETK